MQLFIDCLLWEIPDPDSETTLIMEPPSRIRTGGILNGPDLDLSEVYILDPQNVNTILETFETSNYVPYLKILTKNCKFHTVKRILLSLNTIGPSITKYGGTHCMLVHHTVSVFPDLFFCSSSARVPQYCHERPLSRSGPTAWDKW
jgi:hypothetical protein